MLYFRGQRRSVRPNPLDREDDELRWVRQRRYLWKHQQCRVQQFHHGELVRWWWWCINVTWHPRMIMMFKNVWNMYEGDCGPAENNRCLEFRSWAIPGWAKKMPSQMKSLNFSDIPHLFAIFLLILFFSSESRSLQPKWDELYSYLSSPTGFQVDWLDTMSISD